MHVHLTITAGPHSGREFDFDRPDSFLVGRSPDAHFQLPQDDPFFSRRHFLLEIDPPRCRLLDLGSRNGTSVNGVRVQSADLEHGDTIQAGGTAIRVDIRRDDGPLTLPLTPAPSTPTSSMTEMPPAAPHFPGYAILGEMGRGGMGVVYRAKRRGDDADVAVKILGRGLDTDPQNVERFLREARILGRLDHPHIVRFIDCGEAEGVVFLVMELIDGTSASRMLRETGPLPVRTAVRLVSQLLKALAHAHGLGFVHRDIKPANILIELQPSRRNVKLADFGLGRAYAASQLSGLSVNGQLGGTLAYMPPEQITHFRDAKPCSDQYAAAATLYHLLTNHFPHDLPEDTSAQVVHILNQRPVPIGDRRGDVAVGLSAIIHRAMSPEPDDRYPDVEAFRAELNHYAR